MVAAAAVRKAGRERFYLLTPPPGGPRARRDGLMRGRVRGKRNDSTAVRYFPRSARAKGTVTIFCSFEGI